VNERVLAWLRDHGYPTAVSVDSVQPYGSDWNGDTEQGFYSSFSVHITFTYGAYEPLTSGWMDVEGAAMQSLWHAVVAE
jgi:hypothetical protein